MQFPPGLPVSGMPALIGGLPNPFIQAAALVPAAPMIKPVDPKIAAFGFNCSMLLARERIGPQKSDQLRNIRVRSFDFSVDGSSDIALMLDAMSVQHETIKLAEVPVFLMNFRLTPESHIVIISGLIVPQPKEVFQAFTEFVNGGGKLIVVNSLPFLVGQMFPGYWAPMAPSTLLGARLRVAAEKDLVGAMTDGDYIFVDQPRFHVNVNTKAGAKVLVKLSTPKQEPMLIKATIGSGVLYMFTLKGIQQKQEKGFDYSAELRKKGASLATVTAWECLRKVHFDDAFEMAYSTFGFFESLARILLKEGASLSPVGYAPLPPAAMSDVPMAPPPMPPGPPPPGFAPPPFGMPMPGPGL